MPSKKIRAIFGKRTLAEACAEGGVISLTLAAQVGQAVADRPWGFIWALVLGMWLHSYAEKAFRDTPSL